MEQAWTITAISPRNGFDMATALATIDPMNFPGADHVSEQGPDGYVAYGPAKDRKHKAIAIIREQPDGKYLVEATPAVLNTLGLVTSVSAAEALVKYPIYKTIVEVKTPGRADSIAQHIGPKPVGDTLHGRKIISTEPAVGWTLKRMLDMEYQIADLPPDPLQPGDEGYVEPEEEASPP